MQPKPARDHATLIRQDSEYLTLGCFIAAILIVLIAVGFRVSYDFGLADKEPQHSSHLHLI